MIDLGEDEEKFDQFMMPLTSTFLDFRDLALLIILQLGAFDALGNLLLNDNVISGVNLEEAKKALIGVARDLRGLAFAFNTKTSYMMLFEWM